MLMFCHLSIIFLLLVLIGPPQGVSVVQLSNSSTVRVSWLPKMILLLLMVVLYITVLELSRLRQFSG